MRNRLCAPALERLVLRAFHAWMESFCRRGFAARPRNVARRVAPLRAPELVEGASVLPDHHADRKTEPFPARAVCLWLESSERRDFVIWQGARNAARSAKDQARAMCGHHLMSMCCRPPAWTSFPPPASSKASRDRRIALRCFPRRGEKPCPSNRSKDEPLSCAGRGRPIDQEEKAVRRFRAGAGLRNGPKDRQPPRWWRCRFSAWPPR